MRVLRIRYHRMLLSKVVDLFWLSGNCLTTLQRMVILDGNYPCVLAYLCFVFFLQLDFGKFKLMTPLVTMSFRQLIVDKALFVKLHLFKNRSFLIFAAYVFPMHDR